MLTCLLCAPTKQQQLALQPTNVAAPAAAPLVDGQDEVAGSKAAPKQTGQRRRRLVELLEDDDDNGGDDNNDDGGAQAADTSVVAPRRRAPAAAASVDSPSDRGERTKRARTRPTTLRG